jgi:hypothetical protein
MPPPPGVDPSRPASGSTRSIFEVDFRDGYTVNYNLNVQHQFGTNYMVELAYAGARGRQYMMKGDPNQAPPTVGVTNQNVNRPYYSVAPALTSVGQAQSRGELDYHGLLAKVQRRFANGFSLLGSYTFSKSIDLNSDNDGSVSFLNVYNIEGYHRGVSDYDLTHSLSLSGMYELPLGRGQWWGGWQTSGIVFWRSGYPFTVGQTPGLQSTGFGNRPNIVGDPVLSDPTIDRWFNADAYQRPVDVTGTYGDVGRNTLRGPGQFNIDMSLIKNTRFGRYNLEFRVEAFNLLNHPQFAARPNGTIGNAAVGTITSLLPNPSCALCGTTERNIQFAAKLTF